ncbi:MAG TPA: DNA polymerase IV, partial [Oleiagrimonas sp.]|nr:DNA polymerase IV [Oleiagrimonas sp.]
DFVRYKAVSRQIRAIFAEHTELIEPLSLDEAYLDVTEAARGHSATAIAKAIRARIRETTQLTASAGVAPNKFLAKIASDWNKPDGLCVIRPHQVEAFLVPLEVKRIPGVGKVMQGKLATLGIHTVGDLRTHSREALEQRFGRWGARLYQLARGIDERSVEPHRETLQVSSEDTFENDLTLDELEPHIRRLAEKTWTHHQREAGRVALTVTLKLKTADFHTLTRSLTLAASPADAAELADIACALRQRVDRPDATRYRLVGVGLSGFIDADDYVVQENLFPFVTLIAR